MSDIERQIEQWRKRLRASDALNDSDIEELEGHLREEVERLRRSGLSYAESFLVARYRLGETETLEVEYAKIHPSRRSLLRLSWMAVGVLIYLVAGYVVSGASRGGTVLGIRLGMGIDSILWSGLAMKAMTGAALFLLVWACIRHGTWTSLIARLRAMSLPGLALLLGGLAVLDILLIAFEMLFRTAQVRCVSMEEYARMSLFSSYADLGWGILAPLLAAILVLVLETRGGRRRAIL